MRLIAVLLAILPLAAAYRPEEWGPVTDVSSSGGGYNGGQTYYPGGGGGRGGGGYEEGYRLRHGGYDGGFGRGGGFGGRGAEAYRDGYREAIREQEQQGYGRQGTGGLANLFSSIGKK